MNLLLFSLCNHKERDTRVAFVSNVWYPNVHKRIMITTVDTYSVAIVISLFSQLMSFGLEKLWAEFDV